MKMRNAKHKRYTIKNKLDVISWIETDNEINGSKFSKETIEDL